MSINVEVLGGSMIVQYYVEEIGQPDHLRLVSTSDVFTTTGRTKIGVIWDLVARKIDDNTCGSPTRFKPPLRRSCWTSWASREPRWTSSAVRENRFQRPTAGRRRRCSQKASNVMPYGKRRD
jgi:hypothetical protein